MKTKVPFVVFQDDSRMAEVSVETVRSGRFTTGDALVGLHLPQAGHVVFRGVGATLKDQHDKDSPDIAHALAVSRALRHLARNVEVAAMQEVHSRCASANPLRKLSTGQLIDMVETMDYELGARILAEQEAETKKEEFKKAAKKIPRATVLKRRQERKEARRTKNQGKYKVDPNFDLY